MLFSKRSQSDKVFASNSTVISLYVIITLFRYANRSTWFMDVYIKGLTSAQAAWANRKYHGHQVLPDEILKHFGGNIIFT
ncbi:hypothetical protein K439DRAFT_1564468 [Ramaria rubella]|nr:hypothetical protein K439DRAFT_1564468 [Ramaria rubella]